MAITEKRAERQAKGKNKSESHELDRMGSVAGPDLGVSLLFLTQTLKCAALVLP